jgi:hypothetical protein
LKIVVYADPSSLHNLYIDQPAEETDHESLQHLERQYERFGNGIRFPNVPRPWHADFVGPKQQFTMANFYDPRPGAKLD